MILQLFFYFLFNFFCCFTIISTITGSCKLIKHNLWVPSIGECGTSWWERDGDVFVTSNITYVKFYGTGDDFISSGNDFEKFWGKSFRKTQVVWETEIFQPKEKLIFGKFQATHKRNQLISIKFVEVMTIFSHFPG